MTSRAHSSSESVLDRKLSLSSLVDPDLFGAVCASFTDLYDIPIKVFDGSNNLLVDAGTSRDLCNYVHGLPRGNQLCVKCISQIKTQDLPVPAREIGIESEVGAKAPPSGVDVVFVNCFTGLRYAVVPIHHDQELVGRLVAGPYIPSQLKKTPGTLSSLGADPARVKEQYRQIRRVSDELIHRVMDNLTKVVSVILYTTYKRLLTTNIHLESITTSYRELKQQNLKLTAAHEKMQELDRLKSSFLATISHELRTPLTAVMGYSEMLLEGIVGKLNVEQGHYIRTIIEKSESLLQMITGLLDISKIESGTLTLNITNLELPDIVDAALATVVPLAAKKSVQLVTELEDDLPTIEGDRDKVRQVVLNLVSNAVKFTPTGGTVSVGAERSNMPLTGKGSSSDVANLFQPYRRSALRIWVKDTGVGIPEDQAEKVFQSFYQVDGSSTREHSGAGLGLAIAKSFVEAHNGSIWVERSDDPGTCICFALPIEK